MSERIKDFSTCITGARPADDKLPSKRSEAREQQVKKLAIAGHTVDSILLLVFGIGSDIPPVDKSLFNRAIDARQAYLEKKARLTKYIESIVNAQSA